MKINNPRAVIYLIRNAGYQRNVFVDDRHSDQKYHIIISD